MKSAIDDHTSKGPEEPHYVGHRERLRKRFHQAGAKGFHDYELLELLLTYAIPRKDVKPVAKGLIKRFGSMAGVLDASITELEDVPGLGPRSAVLIQLVKELLGTYLAERVKGRDLMASPQQVVDFAKVRLAAYPHEVFMVIYVNAKNEVIDEEIVHEGTVDRTVVYPRRIVESALAHHAAGLVLVHNHPSGHTEPSEEDKRITYTIIEAAHTMDIRIVDHIIVGKEGYFSFMEHNLVRH